MTNETENSENMELFERLQRQIDLNFKRKKNAHFYVDTLREDAIVLNRIAVQYAGVTIHEMIGQRVIKECETLKQAGMAIADIAQVLGFSNADYLGNYLKKFPGSDLVLARAIINS